MGFGRLSNNKKVIVNPQSWGLLCVSLVMKNCSLKKIT